jgi:hypothetical protein
MASRLVPNTSMSSTLDFPCARNCLNHQDLFKPVSTRRNHSTCIVSNLPTELILRICSELDVLSQAAFALSHAVFYDIIGVQLWDNIKQADNTHIKDQLQTLLSRDYIRDTSPGLRKDHFRITPAALFLITPYAAPQPFR